MLHLYRWHMQSIYFGHYGLSGFHASQSHDVPLSPTKSSGRAAAWLHEDEVQRLVVVNRMEQVN
jgi:hypothetical protein